MEEKNIKNKTTGEGFEYDDGIEPTAEDISAAEAELEEEE